ncbi:MAG: sugar dehydrogenase [Planctomycetes bacterium RBG_13_62_9]|nr:MAG: sugar dehydrogenase [Planctomycetes bacterium RBG_13_62_9]
MKPLAGQIALVTGASSGIGAEIAIAMGAAGAKVGVNYPFDKEPAGRVVSEITGSGGQAISLQADVSREDQVVKMFKTLIDEYGTIDILVSNAGIQKDSAFADMTLEQWMAVINVNLTGSFLCAREAAKEFLRRGVVPERSKAAGKIIFTSSVHEIIPWAGHANYATSKGGMMMLMKTIAQELAPMKIRANSIGPGAIETPINEKVWRDPQGAASMCRLIPYGRIGETKDVASVAVWLASDAADYITGTTIFVDGGMLLYPGFRTGG